MSVPSTKSTSTTSILIIAISLLLQWSAYSDLLGEEANGTKEKPSDIKICLTMIVKNESKIIERCLDSVKDVVDCVSICDTGSTDNTVEVIELFLKTHRIPGKVHHHPWENFGYNRTLSAIAAKEFLTEMGFELSNTYLLLLDADMELKVTPGFQKEALEKDEYCLVQTAWGLSHSNTRLIRASLPWECIGPTHEYWSCKQIRRSACLESLWINDLDDGGCKSDKFERDVRLLTKGLEEEPANVRYMFYLAQSFRCLKQYDEAIKWYTERIKRGGWKEEVWYSKMMIGQCYEDVKDWDQALKYYLEAYQYHPLRSEPLEKIATHYRLEREYDLAYLFAAQGMKIPYPKQQFLFISDPVYNYRFDEEVSISAFYTPYRAEGYAAIERLLFNKAVPPPVKQTAEKNLRFYVERLGGTVCKKLPIEPPPVHEGSQLRTNPANPSIITTENGYIVICRCVNYLQKGAKYYRMIDPGEQTIHVKTLNFILHYDKDFNLLSQKEIIDGISPYMRQKPYTLVDGLEDSRLFAHNNALWATCTVQDMNSYHLPQIGLIRLGDPARQADHVDVEHFVPLETPQPGRCEKNWLPFIKDGQLQVIYSYDPLKIYLVNPSTGQCKLVVNKPQQKDFSLFRGSAGPIPFDDGYLAVVHHVSHDNERYYFHRFIHLDNNFNIKGVSRPFTFLGKQIEFCCGMTVDHSSSKILLTVGIEDREAVLVFIDLPSVRTLLVPVD